MGSGTPGAGWYPDPLERADYRYWDGSDWTADESVGPVPPDPVPDGRQRDDEPGASERSPHRAGRRWLFLGFGALVVVVAVAAFVWVALADDAGQTVATMPPPVTTITPSTSQATTTVVATTTSNLAPVPTGTSLACSDPEPPPDTLVRPVEVVCSGVWTLVRQIGISGQAEARLYRDREFVDNLFAPTDFCGQAGGPVGTIEQLVGLFVEPDAAAVLAHGRTTIDDCASPDSRTVEFLLAAVDGRALPYVASGAAAVVQEAATLRAIDDAAIVADPGCDSASRSSRCGYLVEGAGQRFGVNVDWLGAEIVTLDVRELIDFGPEFLCLPDATAVLAGRSADFDVAVCLHPDGNLGYVGVSRDSGAALRVGACQVVPGFFRAFNLDTTYEVVAQGDGTAVVEAETTSGVVVLADRFDLSVQPPPGSAYPPC